MRTRFIALALSGIAVPAFAQRNAIDIKVRLAGTEKWEDQINYVSPAGSTVPAHIEVAVFYQRVSGYGFSGSVHNVTVGSWDVANDVITLLDRPDSAQHPDGRQGRFNFGAQRQAAYLSGADNSARISAANNTQDALGGGISVKQNTPIASGTLFDTNNPAMGFRFDMTLSCRANAVITNYELTIPPDRVFNFTLYNSSTSTSGSSVNMNTLVLDGATVTTQWQQVPAPCSVAIGLCGVALARRRR